MTTSEFPAGSGTVLVVEDEDLVRMLVVETLEECGYTVIEAADARAALSVLDSDTPISLLITDIGLPGMNGRDLGDAARTRRPELKILFMTGYAPRATGDGLGALAPGMAVLNKPFSVELLAEKVRGMMTGE